MEFYKHSIESIRVDAVKELAIIGSMKEQIFEDIAFIAATVCNVPIAFVGFIDDKVQWFKSIRGITLDSIPREISLCSFMISSGERLVVENLSEHSTLQDNPFVTGELHIRSCVSIPIVNHENLILGSLCVVDDHPRKFTERELSSLEALARQVEEHIEVRRRTIAAQKIAQAEQKIIESQLLRSEFRLTSVLEKLPNIVLYETSNNKDREQDKEREYVSENIIDMLGYPSEQFTSDSSFFASLVHHEDIDKTEAAIQEWIANGQVGMLSLEFRCRHSNGEYRWLQDSVVCVKTTLDEDDWYMSGVIIDITERRNAEEQLRQTSSNLNALFNNSSQAFILLDREVTVLACNKIAQIGALAIWGKDLEVGMNGMQVISNEYKQQYIDYCTIAFSGKSHVIHELLVPTYNNRELWLEMSFVPIIEEDGSITKICCSGLNITKRKKAQKKLLEAEKNYQSIVENAVIGIFQVLPNGEFLSVNPAMASMLGFNSPEELMKHRDAIDNYVLPEKRREFIELLNQNGYVNGFEFQGKKRNGEIVWYIQGARAVHADSSPQSPVIYYEGFSRDISEQKKVEHKLQTSLHEKELLLKEIHHRVKNNLQIISSLLNLQAELITDETMLGLFKDSQSRVRTMALIHEQLYRSFNVGVIHLRSYVQYLVQFLERTHHRASCRIEFRIEIEEIDLAIDLAIPCGLIINELVSNALKYAFAEVNEGIITVGIRRILSNKPQILMEVGDNGCGFSSKVQIENPPTLGLQLVQMLTKQLDGTVSFDSANQSNRGGVDVKIIFPEITKIKSSNEKN
jgi:PAS domain S-box-containing protein